MNTLKKILLLGIFIVALPFACGESSKDDDTQNIPAPGTFETVTIAVVIPSTVDLDLATTQVSSLFEDHPVSTDNLTNATYPTEGRSIATLQDSSGQSLLMGFITDGKRQISVASTVEALIYIGLGTIFLPDEIKQQFFTEANTWPGFDELVSQSETLFSSDPYFVDSAAFNTLLQNYLTTLAQPDNIIDNTALRMSFTADIRSGIQLEEAPGDALILVNKYRRRAHAHFYKTSYKDLNDNETVLINNVATSNASFKNEVIVEPVSGFSSFLGTFQSAAEGKGLEFSRKDSNPTTLKLLDNENEAKFKIRVIGPSPVPAPLTTQEHDRLTRLNLETLAFDFSLPLLLSTVGGDNFLKDFKASKWETFLTAFEEVVKALPNVSKPLFDGNIKKATTEFIVALSNSTNASIFEGLYKALIDNISGLSGGFSQENSQLIIARSEHFFSVVKLIDVGLEANDIYRIFSDIFSSNTLEEWEVDLTRNKVSLDPKETLVIQGEEKVFKVNIQDSNLAQGESYEYRYSIENNYGELRSKSSSATGISIISSSNQIGYFSSNTISLPDNAKDAITVNVYINHGTSAPLTKVGEATATIEIKTLGFIIDPDGLTIDGGTLLKMYVKRSDGTNPVTDAAFDYRFIWYTAADYGLYNGTQSDISVVNDNSIIYEVLDKETPEGTEDFEVSIYTREKNTNNRYRFINKVTSQVHIENDPLKESFFLDLTTVGKPPHIVNNIYCEWSVQNAVYFSPFTPPDGLEVVDYTLTITEGWSAILGTGQTWLPATTASDIEEMVTIYVDGVDTTEMKESVYVYRIGGTGAQGNAGYCDGTASTDYANKVSLYNSFESLGKAQVVITLKSNN